MKNFIVIFGLALIGFLMLALFVQVYSSFYPTVYATGKVIQVDTVGNYQTVLRIQIIKTNTYKDNKYIPEKTVVLSFKESFARGAKPGDVVDFQVNWTASEGNLLAIHAKSEAK